MEPREWAIESLSEIPKWDLTKKKKNIIQPADIFLAHIF